jgi:hypothetical protein
MGWPMSANDPKQTLASSFRRHEKSWRGLCSLSASRNVYLPSGHFCPTFETLVIQNAVAQLQGAIPRFAC